MDKSKLPYTTAAVAASPVVEVEFYDVPGFCRAYSIGRSFTYDLLGDGSIESVTLRRRGQIRGRRLINAESARKFFASQPSDVSAAARRYAKKAQKKSAAARAVVKNGSSK
jgi:hypothetical protein